MLMIAFHKKEIDEFGRLASMGLKRIMFGVVLGHMLLLFISFYHSRDYAFGINIVMILMYLIFTVWMVRRLHKINSLECLEYNKSDNDIEWTDEQKAKWIEMYSHPVLKHRPEVKHDLLDWARRRHKTGED